MFPSSQSNFECKLFKRKENKTDYETIPVKFNAVFMSNSERTLFNNTLGLSYQTNSINLKTTNLDLEIRVGDMVEYLGQRRFVEASTDFINDSRITNFDIFGVDTLKEHYIKGIRLV